jgi:hypothetical protein
MKRTLASIALITALNVNASLGPIPIYLNTEYRTNSPVISAISSTLSFSADDIKASGANTFLDFILRKVKKVRLCVGLMQLQIPLRGQCGIFTHFHN